MTAKQKKPRAMLPFWIRYTFFFENYKVLANFVFIIAIGFSVYYFFPGFFGTSIIDLFNNSAFTGILGTILGVIGGGVFQYYAQRKQFEAEAAINRKNTIYAPLYEEMMRLRSVFKDGGFPDKYKLSSNELPFNEDSYWNNIRKDSRLFEVPNYVFDMYQELIQRHNTYVHLHAEASKLIQDKANEIASQRHGGVFNHDFLGSKIVIGGLSFAIDSEELFYTLFNNYGISIVDETQKRNTKSNPIPLQPLPISDEDKRQLVKEIHDAVCSLPILLELKSSLARYIEYTENFVYTFYTIITQIDRIYGRQRKEF